MSDGSGKDRKLLQVADKLLKEAGWQIKDGKRTNAKGEVLDVEFLIDIDPSSERILAGYVESLRRLGVSVSVRRVEAAEYERRRKTFDFDVIGARYALRSTPGAELRTLWSSEAAKTDGSCEPGRHQTAPRSMRSSPRRSKPRAARSMRLPCAPSTAC